MVGGIGRRGSRGSLAMESLRAIADSTVTGARRRAVRPEEDENAKCRMQKCRRCKVQNKSAWPVSCGVVTTGALGAGHVTVSVQDPNKNTLQEPGTSTSMELPASTHPPFFPSIPTLPHNAGTCLVRATPSSHVVRQEGIRRGGGRRARHRISAVGRTAAPPLCQDTTPALRPLVRLHWLHGAFVQPETRVWQQDPVRGPPKVGAKGQAGG